MYLVVSYWKALPGHYDQAKAAGTAMSKLMRTQPGVTFMESFESNDKIVAVHGYADETTYNRIVSDPAGLFVKAAQEHGLEQHLEWLGSDRGTTIADG